MVFWGNPVNESFEAFEEGLDLLRKSFEGDDLPHGYAEGVSGTPEYDLVALDMMEEDAAPGFLLYHGIDEDPGLRKFMWQDADVPPSPEPFEYPLDSNLYRSFSEDLEDNLEDNDYDFVVGVYRGGLPFMYTALNQMDAKPAVVKYQHQKSKTEGKEPGEVDIPPGIQRKVDFEDANILIIDDDIYTGKTISEVAQRLLEENPENVDAVTGRGNFIEDPENAEVYAEDFKGLA
ncbi:MAG: phosphoribosyltransferase [Candidatus Nanohalobium sp.]